MIHVPRVKKKDYENLTATNIEKVISHLRADSPISKKEACAMLNIAYNTTRLQNIIDDYEDNCDSDGNDGDDWHDYSGDNVDTDYICENCTKRRRR